MKTIVLCLSLLSVVALVAGAEPQPIDACNKPEFCTSDTKVPDPEECGKYYWCVKGSWTRVDCPTGTLFDNVTLNCTHLNQTHCQPECPPFTGRTTERVTQRPEPCEIIGQCVGNKKYPDKSSCRNYYLCAYGRQVELKQCPDGKVFDIKVADCIEPYNGYNCYDQCANPGPPHSGSTMERATVATVIGLSLAVLCLRRP